MRSWMDVEGACWVLDEYPDECCECVLNTVMLWWKTSQETLSCENSFSLHVVEKIPSPGPLWVIADTSGYTEHASWGRQTFYKRIIQVPPVQALDTAEHT